jgi:hypothetical protein
VRLLRRSRLVIAVQKLGRGIKTIRPYDRSCLVVDPDLPKVRWVAQALPKRPANQESAVDIALNAIVERNPQAIAIKRLDASDSEHHRFMLRQRLDRRQGLQCLSAHPVISELLHMEACPRPNEPQRTRRKRAIENPQGSQLDLSDLLAVLGMEVRWWVIGTVHPNDDPIEGGETRHRGIVG